MIGKNVVRRLRNVGYGAALAVLSTPLMMSVAQAQMKKAPKDVCDGMDTFIGWFQWFAGGLAVVSFAALGIGMFLAWNHRGGAMQLLEKILMSVGGCIFVAAAGSLAAVFVQRGNIC